MKFWKYILPILSLNACTTPPYADDPAVPSRVRAHTLRLKPGQELTEELEAWAKSHRIRAATIVSAVGSLTRVSLRYANQKNATSGVGHFEVVSLVGTLNEESMHLHLSVSDGRGNTLGGHLMPGSVVYTTAEVVIAELEDADYLREQDLQSGYRELKVKPRSLHR